MLKKWNQATERIAKIEAGDPSVSLDLLFRALLSSGATRQEVAEVIQGKKEKPKELVTL